jgi:hypothetical protein
LEKIKALYGRVTVYHAPPWDGLLTAWFRWDAVHYLNLAQFGYHAHSTGSSLFYPLYPLFIRLAAMLFWENTFFSALFVSTVSFFFYLSGFYLLTHEYFDNEIAKWSRLAILCYPFSVFLLAPFSEPLYLAMTIWMFLAASKHKWLIAGILGFASGLTRGPALLSSLALLTLLFAQHLQSRRNFSILFLGRTASALSPFLGGWSFLIWRHTQGYPPIPQVLAEYGIELKNPVTAMVAAIAQWMHVMDFYTTIDILSAALFLTLFLVIVFRREKYPFYLTVYYASNLLLYLSKIHHEASSLQSMSRYTLTLFPAFWVIGEWLSTQRPLPRFAILVISFGLLLIFSGLYTMWVFIG